MSSQQLWTKGEHTEGKHLILKYYLDGWFPILGSSHTRILYIDGFAGPGEYSGGEPGSPVIALECVKQQKRGGKLKNAEIVCLFMETDTSHANHLERVLQKFDSIPDITLKVLVGEFDNNMTAILNYLEEQKKNLPRHL